jgi:hypothetical protein
MTFSIGQNFFNDLLKSSDKRTHNDQKAIEQTAQLQQRLNDFWKNNNKPVLLKSKKVSGMRDLLGNSEPLGGHINWQLCGITNLPHSCKDGCPDEYPFWGTTEVKKEININQKENFEEINEAVEQPEIIEKFTMSDVPGLNYGKENFGISNKTSIIIIVLIVVLLLGLCGLIFLNRNKNN